MVERYLGIGFLVISFGISVALILGFAGIFKYIVVLAKEKLGVVPSKEYPKLNDSSGKS